MGGGVAPAIRRFPEIGDGFALTTKAALRLLTGAWIAIMVRRSPFGGVNMGAIMSVVAALLLLLGQPSSGSAGFTPGAGGIHPDSGGIPTTPPPPPPQPFPSMQSPNG
jgi:hypothetical protein